MSKIIKQLPMLYGIATNGKIKTVNYYVEELEDGTCNIVNEHGYLDGKKQTDRRNVKTGKNIGKANETTTAAQAISEATSKWQKKIDSNYTENKSGRPDAEEKSLLPMLAHDYRKRSHNIKFPCLVQPKIDGVRCMLSTHSDHAYRFSSRKDKTYDTLSHLLIDLSKILSKYHIDVAKTPLDGEIYRHGLTLQEINRRVKKNRGAKTKELEYWIFDIADPSMRDEDRQEMLAKVSLVAQVDKIRFVDSIVAYNDAEIKKYHDEFVQQGFEGAIIRNMDGKYAFNKRSADLQKYKEFIDDEFKIVGTTSGEGREHDAIIFVCQTDKGLEFPVRPRGLLEMRRKMMEDADSYIGKDLTVRFFNYTEDGLPFLPVGITVRDYE